MHFTAVLTSDDRPHQNVSGS